MGLHRYKFIIKMSAVKLSDRLLSCNNAIIHHHNYQHAPFSHNTTLVPNADAHWFLVCLDPPGALPGVDKPHFLLPSPTRIPKKTSRITARAARECQPSNETELSRWTTDSS